MAGLTQIRAALAAVAGVGVLVAGFLVGGAIGDSEDPSASNKQTPSRITTRQSSVHVPTLGETKRIPTLAAPEQTAQATVEESTAPTSTPSAPVEESPPAEEKSPAPVPESEPTPEVTVAPDG